MTIVIIVPLRKKETYNFNVVSNDSLLLSNSPVIIFIIAVISVVNDPQDMISRALMLRFFLLAKGNEEADKVPLVSDKLIEGSRVYFPEGYEDFLERIRQMPLFEATESIIKFFRTWRLFMECALPEYFSGLYCKFYRE